jgi:hypothetical protein
VKKTFDKNQFVGYAQKKKECVMRNTEHQEKCKKVIHKTKGKMFGK